MTELRPDEALLGAFEQTFGAAPQLIARAPGRVNLIGEHTDYNDGWVLPVAVSFDVVVLARPRADRLVRLRAIDLDREAVFSLDDRQAAESLWVRYPQGSALALADDGASIRGLDAVYSGDVPIGAGLSSSAAVEVAFVRAFAAASGVRASGVEVARIAQRAETAYVGVPSGIMDQFISSLGKRDHALLLDCRSLEFSYIPLNLPGIVIAVIDTGGRRQLARSEYHLRRADCEAAVRRLKSRLPEITALRDVSADDLYTNRDVLTDVQFRRARHVVEENERTLQAAEALRNGDLQRVGDLMRSSHESLRDLYEVSSPELDAAVEIAWSVSGVVGARMTGAGFGGAAVAFVEASAVETLRDALAAQFPLRTGHEAQLFLCTAVDGAEVRELPPA